MKMMSLPEIFSLECFLNSLLREWNGAEIHPDKLVFKNNLVIPLLKKSCATHFQVAPNDLNFKSVIEALTDLYLKANNYDDDKKELFLSRVFESLENIRLTLEKRSDEINERYEQKDISFIEAEQALYIGHTFHPYPKTRGGFSDEDFLKYSPEMGGDFSLKWYLVHPEMIYEQKAQNFKNNWTQEILKNHEINNDYIPMPIHPWQEQHLLKLDFIKDAIENKKIIILSNNDVTGDEQAHKWQATTSLRTVYNNNSPYMLKYSLTLRLTNSIRHLQEVEVVRGMQVHDVFHTELGETFLKEHPYFHILFEPGFMAFKNPEGQILKESIVVCRHNPFVGANTKNMLVLATLNQKSPDNKKTLVEVFVQKYATLQNIELREAIMTWFDSYLNFVLKPLITLACDYGVYLGAHAQNLILKIDDMGLVNESYFRDCQGTGYSQLGYQNFGSQCPSLKPENGNILPDDFANTLFSYYLIINSTLSVIESLSFNQHIEIEEDTLYQKLKDFFENMRLKGVKNSSLLNYLLDSREWWQKGNFVCCFKDINENTVVNPLSIYNKIPNPLFNLGDNNASH